jgi:hypothetical protein
MEEENGVVDNNSKVEKVWHATAKDFVEFLNDPSNYANNSVGRVSKQYVQEVFTKKVKETSKEGVKPSWFNGIIGSLKKNKPATLKHITEYAEKHKQADDASEVEDDSAEEDDDQKSKGKKKKKLNKRKKWDSNEEMELDSDIELNRKISRKREWEDNDDNTVKTKKDKSKLIDKEKGKKSSVVFGNKLKSSKKGVMINDEDGEVNIAKMEMKIEKMNRKMQQLLRKIKSKEKKTASLKMEKEKKKDRDDDGDDGENKEKEDGDDEDDNGDDEKSEDDEDSSSKDRNTKRFVGKKKEKEKEKEKQKEKENKNGELTEDEEDEDAQDSEEEEDEEDDEDEDEVDDRKEEIVGLGSARAFAAASAAEEAEIERRLLKGKTVNELALTDFHEVHGLYTAGDATNLPKTSVPLHLRLAARYMQLLFASPAATFKPSRYRLTKAMRKTIIRKAGTESGGRIFPSGKFFRLPKREKNEPPAVRARKAFLVQEQRSTQAIFRIGMRILALTIAEQPMDATPVIGNLLRLAADQMHNQRRERQWLHDAALTRVLQQEEPADTDEESVFGSDEEAQWAKGNSKQKEKYIARRNARAYADREKSGNNDYRGSDRFFGSRSLRSSRSRSRSQRRGLRSSFRRFETPRTGFFNRSNNGASSAGTHRDRRQDDRDWGNNSAYDDSNEQRRRGGNSNNNNNRSEFGGKFKRGKK